MSIRALLQLNKAELNPYGYRKESTTKHSLRLKHHIPLSLPLRANPFSTATHLINRVPTREARVSTTWQGDHHLVRMVHLLLCYRDRKNQLFNEINVLFLPRNSKLPTVLRVTTIQLYFLTQKRNFTFFLSLSFF